MPADPPAALHDPSHVASLYRAHFGYVWQVLRKLGVDACAAEDATHDVFMIVHRRWHAFEGRSTARTWLFAIARRIAWRYRRTQTRARRRRAALMLVGPPEASDPDAVVARGEAWRSLIAFLDALDEAQREAFVLGEIEGASRSRMGRLLGVSPNTAYSRLQAARRRFAERFPDPDERVAVSRASIPRATGARRRVWALLAASVNGGRTLTLSGWLKVVAGVAVGGTLLLGVVAAGLPARESSAVAAAPSRATDPQPPAARDRAQATPHALTPASLAATDPPPTPTPTSIERPARERRSTPRTEPKPTAPASLHPTKPDPRPDLAPSMARLAQAREALRSGNAADALHHLARSRELDPGDAFATERAVTRIWALCLAGREQEARRELDRLQLRHSTEAYAEVLSKSCISEPINAPRSGDERG